MLARLTSHECCIAEASEGCAVIPDRIGKHQTNGAVLIKKEISLQEGKGKCPASEVVVLFLYLCPKCLLV